MQVNQSMKQPAEVLKLTVKTFEIMAAAIIAESH